MTGSRRVAVELALACLALAGAVWSGVNVASVAAVAPIVDGGPATTSETYDPPVLTLTLLLTTVAAVLLIVAVARWRRGAHATGTVPA